MTVWAQVDARWSDEMLGTGGATIGQAGCLLCTHAQIATDLGGWVQPDMLNNMYRRNGIYIGGNLLPDDGLAKLYAKLGGIDWRVVSVKSWHGDPQDFHAEAWQRVYVGLTFPDHQHFMTVFSWDGHKLLVDDPLLGAVIDFDTRYVRANLTKTVTIGRTPPQAGIPPAPGPDYQRLFNDYKAAVAAWLAGAPK